MGLLWATLVLGASTVFAHPLDLGLVEMEGHGSSVAVRLDLHPDVAAKLLGVSAPTTATFEARASELFATTLGSGELAVAPGEPCLWGFPTTRTLEKTVRIEVEAQCPRAAQSLSWRFPFVSDRRLGENFQLVLQRADGGGTAVAERGRDTGTLALGAAGFGQYVLMGIEHIGAAPSQWVGPHGLKWPDGIDHILFVLALVLGGGTLLQLGRTVTGFTLGHSVTLALGTFGLVSVPSWIVESLIALSIVVVALEAVFDRDPSKRWRVATAFGLIHGLGFATALRELALPKAQLLPALAGYNVGVELGQIALVLVAFPVVKVLRSEPARRRVAIPVCGMPIVLAGAYWFVMRAFGS